MNQPSLRFKEFREDWKSLTLGSITKLITSGSRDWAKHYSECGSKFVRMTNLSRESINLLLDDMKYVNVPPNSTDGTRTSLDAGDILMSITAELGKIGIVPDDFGKAYINQHTALIRIGENANPKFIAQLLATKRQNNIINSLNDSGAKAGLNLPTIKGIKVSIPSLKEQEKIVDFLSSIDEKIVLLSKSLNLTKLYKKGVMQKIFNQEIRFKNASGASFPDWEYLALENILDYKQPTPYLVSSTDYSDDFQIPVLTAGKTFILGYTNEEFGIFSDPLPALIFDDFTTATKYVDFPFKAKSSAMKILVGRRRDVNLKYAFEAIQMLDYQVGDEHKRYWISEYSKLEIPYPVSDEQNMIADFLSTFDIKISALKTQLDLIKQYRQGLHQQIFI